jgi:hypothetical protein
VQASARKQLQWQTGYLAREMHCAQIAELYGPADVTALAVTDDAAADDAAADETAKVEAADAEGALDLDTPSLSTAASRPFEVEPEDDEPAVTSSPCGGAQPRNEDTRAELEPEALDRAAVALYEAGVAEADPSFADAVTPCEGVPHDSPQWNSDLDAMELEENSLPNITVQRKRQRLRITRAVSS